MLDSKVTKQIELARLALYTSERKRQTTQIFNLIDRE